MFLSNLCLSREIRVWNGNNNLCSLTKTDFGLKQEKNDNFVNFLHEKQLVNTCIQVINLEYEK